MYLILCFILGFKPRGDDARPDRGLNPLIKMIFNNQVNLDFETNKTTKIY